MSALKKKLAHKLSELFQCEVLPESIIFCRRRKTDSAASHARWTARGYFSVYSATFCVRNDVTLLQSDAGTLEIYAEQTEAVKPYKGHPFDTWYRDKNVK